MIINSITTVTTCFLHNAQIIDFLIKWNKFDKLWAFKQRVHWFEQFTCMHSVIDCFVDKEVETYGRLFV